MVKQITLHYTTEHILGDKIMLELGMKMEISFTVSDAMSAKNVGSGTLDVLATPIMIAGMEEAAWKAVAPGLEEGAGTVGTLMNAKHISPTPLGMAVTCRAELIEIDGRRLVFSVSAEDDKGPIGIGTHERAIIYNDKFQTKANSKLDA